MVNLIISVLSILLTSVCAMTYLSYAPWWHSSATSIESKMRGVYSIAQDSFDKSSSFYGQEPEPNSDPDHGLYSIVLQPISALPLPTPAAGFSWEFGKNLSENNAYSGLKFFCMTPPEEGINYAQYLGIQRALSDVPASVLVVGDTACGGTPSDSIPVPDAFEGSRPIYFTLYVKWTA